MAFPEPTEDPTTVITNHYDDVWEYENTDGRRWRITGTCNACGACEMPPEAIDGQPVVLSNRRILQDGSEEVWNRTIRWYDTPGQPGACLEDGYDQRRDIPITPDGLPSPAEGCLLTGEWLP